MGGLGIGRGERGSLDVGKKVVHRYTCSSSSSSSSSYSSSLASYLEQDVLHAAAQHLVVRLELRLPHVLLYV